MRAPKPVDHQFESEQLSVVFGNIPIENKVASLSKLPEPSRARIAMFCYHKVHLRELGLRLAATCELNALKSCFGTSAVAVKEQAMRIESIIADLNSTRKRDTSRLLIEFS